MKTDNQIVDEVNELARFIYEKQGYSVKEGYRFDKSEYVGENWCWSIAADIHEMYTDDDVDCALDNLEEEE